jgi:hypothetical protein
MPLPPNIDEKIRKQFVSILNRASAIATDEGLYTQLKIELFSLIHFIDPNSIHFQSLRDEINQLDSSLHSRFLKYVKGLDNSYRAGMFESITETIEANVTSDYMTQAENLLSGAGSGEFAHVPAAVLAGAVLEDTLRRLCQRQSPSIPMVRKYGNLKSLNDFINDLKHAGLYTELKAKQLRVWAGIRNAAAHGEFDDFTCDDVQQMLDGIQSFLAENKVSKGNNS